MFPDPDKTRSSGDARNAARGTRVAARDGNQAPSERMADQALRALYDLYAGPLFSFALRFSGDPQRAEEAVQDALVRAWQHPEALERGRGSPRAFLFILVRNALIDSWRRDAARPRTSGGDRLEGPDVPDPVEGCVESWMLTDAVARLSAEHRQVLLHAFFLDHSVEQTATAIGVPAGTVKSRTFYALRALRAALEEVGYLR